MLMMPTSASSSTTGRWRIRCSRHQLHELVDVIGAGAGLHLGLHDRRHRLVEERRAVGGQPAHDVALGHDAGERRAVGGHHQRADVGGGEGLGGARTVASGGIVETSRPLRCEDLIGQHVQPPLP